VVILDDGFQNPALAHDLSIVVADAARGFGNGAVIPAGPLREPVATGLSRADLLLTIGDPAAQARFDLTFPVGLPRLRGALEPLQTGMDWQDMRVLAFAGIGDPGKFFRTLRGLGAELAESHALDDHQPLSTALIQRLTARAQALDARLVTTEKDAVRLPQALRTEVLTVVVRLRLEDPAPLDAALDRVLG
jgi:tetraacyldisaccharide 4'-kinase